MPSEPRWLSAETLTAINATVVADTGEPHLTLDPGLLESAVARPVNIWLYGDTKDLVQLATTLLFGVARNHPFQQGNKRTAWAAFVIMLELNGHEVAVPDIEATAQAVVDVITGAKDEAWFCGFVSPHVR